MPYACPPVGRRYAILRVRAMTNYLVRIYRKAGNSRRTVVGVVKEVGVEGNRAFSNLDELWEILNSSKAKTTNAGNRNKSLKG
jgi:hypothetical protein